MLKTIVIIGRYDQGGGEIDKKRKAFFLLQVRENDSKNLKHLRYE